MNTNLGSALAYRAECSASTNKYRNNQFCSTWVVSFLFSELLLSAGQDIDLAYCNILLCKYFASALRIAALSSTNVVYSNTAL